MHPGSLPACSPVSGHSSGSGAGALTRSSGPHGHPTVLAPRLRSPSRFTRMPPPGTRAPRKSNHI